MEQERRADEGTAAGPGDPVGSAAPVAGRLPGVSAERLWDVARHHGVIRMRLVGGWARGDAPPDAPIELIVGYNRKVSRMDVIRLQLEFEGLAGRRVIVREESTVSLADREELRREARLL